MRVQHIAPLPDISHPSGKQILARCQRSDTSHEHSLAAAITANVGSDLASDRVVPQVTNKWQLHCTWRVQVTEKNRATEEILTQGFSIHLVRAATSQSPAFFLAGMPFVVVIAKTHESDARDIKK